MPSRTRKADRSRALSFASIIRLLLHRGPSAISRLIVSRIVNAINCMLSRWPLSHIGQKVLVESPTLAHLNSSFRVIGISFSGISRTASSHASPRSVSNSSTGCMTMAKRQIMQEFCRRFFVQTATTGSVAIPQADATRGNGISASTFAQPKNHSLWVSVRNAYCS